MASVEIQIEETNVTARPFLKWAGSKSKLLHKLKPYLPSEYERYVEPFLGSASLFFALAPTRAILSDKCEPLIQTYRAVRDGLPHILRYLNPLVPNKRLYYQIRRNQSPGRFKGAAEFIYLNKTCWNGLYRVNSDGQFNVPYGLPRSDGIFVEKSLRRCSELLRRKSVSLNCRDFEKTLDVCRQGDFVFLDPPYVTTHQFNGFAEWNETIFSWKDQVRLAEAANELARSGANVLVTNAMHEDTQKLYKHFSVRSFRRRSTLASDSSRRVRVEEAIFYSGPDMPKG